MKCRFRNLWRGRSGLEPENQVGSGAGITDITGHVAPNHCWHVDEDGIGRRKILDVNQGVPSPQCGPPLGGIDAKAHLLLGSEGSTREARGSRVAVSTASVGFGWPNRACQTNGLQNRCGTTERHGTIHLRKNTASGRVIRGTRRGNGCARTTTASISYHIHPTRRTGFVPSVPGSRQVLSNTTPTHPTRYSCATPVFPLVSSLGPPFPAGFHPLPTRVFIRLVHRYSPQRRSSRQHRPRHLQCGQRTDRARQD